MPAAIILAGGLGTRLRSVVPDLPKPMAPIDGRPFLEYQLDYWIGQGIDRFVLSVGYRREAVLAHFGRRYNGARIDYAVEETPLGTGGALLLAAGQLDGDQAFLVLNGDTYFAVELAELVAFADTHSADWCFALFQPAESGRYMGMDLSPEGRVIALKSGSAQPGRPANGGVYWMRAEALRDCGFAPGAPCSLEDDLAPAAMNAGQRLFGREFSGPFIDIGVPGDYRRAAAVLAAAAAQEPK